MEEKKELQELLVRLDESNRKQARYALLQCIMTAVMALCCIALFVLVYTLMPQLQALTAQTESVLGNLETVTDQLAGMDLGSMVKNVDELVSTSQSGVEEAVEKLNALDFEALNKAIRDLSSVVEPLARFFHVFG